MGSIRKRNNLKGITYLARVRVNKRDTSKTFLKKEDARKWIANKENEIYKNNFTNRYLEKITLKELIEKYLNEIVFYQKSKKLFTNRWKRIIKFNPDLVNLKINKITPQHILDYRNKRLIDGKRTTNLDLIMLHTLFEKAIKLWQIPLSINPVKYIEKFPETKGRHRPIYSFEYRKILVYAKKYNFKFYLSIIILKNCCLRPNELLSLKFEDIDKVSKLIIIKKSKTNRVRVVPINLFILNLIYFSKNNYDSDKIIPYKISGFNSAFKRMCFRLNIKDLQPHDFRRSYALRYLNKNKGDIAGLAKIGGWSSWDMVQRYYGK